MAMSEKGTGSYFPVVCRLKKKNGTGSIFLSASKEK